MEEPSVHVSLKEIYDETKKLSEQMSLMNLRMDNIEKRLDTKETRSMTFADKVKMAFISALIPIGFAVIYFVAKGGGL